MTGNLPEKHKTDLEESLDTRVLEYQEISDLVPLGDQVRVRNRLQNGLLEDYLHIQDLEEMKKHSDRDGLTGLLKYDAFLRDLTEEVAAARDSGDYLSLIFMDGDRFKQYNDEFSHEVGNLVVKSFGGLLSDMIMGSGKIYRYGGDEFVAIIKGKTPEEAAAQAEYLCGQIGKGIPYYIDATLATDPNYKVTADRLRTGTRGGMRMYDSLIFLASQMRVSCGVYSSRTTGPISNEDYVRTFIETADEYLKEAKRLGRNRVMSSFGVVELD